MRPCRQKLVSPLGVKVKTALCAMRMLFAGAKGEISIEANQARSRPQGLLNGRQIQCLYRTPEVLIGRDSTIPDLFYGPGTDVNEQKQKAGPGPLIVRGT